MPTGEPTQNEFRRRLQISLVLIVGLILAGSLLDPRFPQEQLLQHIPTVPLMAIILLGAMRGWWSTLSVSLLMVFALLHILGARFVYSCVPYDEWIQGISGWSVNEAFGWRRNHYDRVVHLLFGMLLPLPLAELLAGRCPLPAGLNTFLSICIVTAVGGVYEVLEWLAAVVMSPEFAESYNGQQGDIWDAQKDMGLALVGSLLVAVSVWRRMRRAGLSPGQRQ